VPTTILTSEDDPVVPVNDIRTLPENPNIELLVSRYGGHCGFLTTGAWNAGPMT